MNPALPPQRDRDASLLGALFSAQGGTLSRSELARAGGMPVRELPQALEPYISAGYPIAYHPQGGIVLQEPPDIWCAEEILGRCPPSDAALKWDPLLLIETTSTNSVARDLARKGARAGFLVAAARQTKGRGRLGRTWESPTGGGLYVSILLRPTLPASEVGRLTIISSVAAADAVEKRCNHRPKIKWPNDLVLNHRKLAGLLLEAEPRGRDLAFAVIGIGLNVRQREEDFSEAVRSSATSLFLATGRLYRRADLLVDLLHALTERLRQPFAEVRAAWAESSLTLGQQVILSTAQGVKQGQALGLDEAGALLLRTDSGEIEVVSAGDMQAVA